MGEWWRLSDAEMAERYPALARRDGRVSDPRPPRGIRTLPLGKGREVRFELPERFTLADVAAIRERLLAEHGSES